MFTTTDKTTGQCRTKFTSIHFDHEKHYRYEITKAYVKIYFANGTFKPVTRLYFDVYFLRIS